MGALMVWLALIGKESRALLPHWIGMVSLVTLFGILQLFGDSLTLMPVSERVSGGAEGLLLVFLLAFASGHATLGPEFFSNHIEFLDGLPVRRIELFLCKLIAVILPSAVTVGISLMWDLGSSWLSPGAPGASPFLEIGWVHALLGVGAVVGIGSGMLASWLGSLGWGIVLLGLFSGGVGAVIIPSIRPYTLGFGSFGTLEFIHGEATHPVLPVVMWLVLSGLFLTLSGLLFLGPGGSLTQRGSLATGAIRVVSIGCFSLLVLGCGGLGLLGILLNSPSLLKPITIETTENFRVLFDPDFSDPVHLATSDLESLSQSIAASVGNTRPVRLDLEFLGAQDNHAGLFTGGKIRLQRDADRAVVAHELVHAHAFAITGPAAWRQKSHTRFFDEGLASWVAAKMEGTSTLPELAMAIHALDPVEFDLLVEDEQWVVERDIAQPYPLGVVFLEAIDQTGGVDLRQCLLKEIGTFGDREIAGLALWVGLADRCGVVLDEVIDRFETLLEGGAAALPPLPAVQAKLVGSDLWVTDSQKTGRKLICRFRSSEEAEVGTYQHLPVKEGRCALPLSQLPELTFGYQVGFRFGGDVVFERWVEAPTP